MNLRALVLWDIDGTLVDSAKLGRDAFLIAFERITGAPPAQLVPFAGRTDLEIAADLLEQSGHPVDDGVVAAFEGALAAAMAGLADEVRRRGRAYPGAKDSLERLRREAGVVQGLLTGNIPANARVKLGAVGLDGLVDFDIGGYGSDHRVRSELVAIACERAERKLGVHVPPARAVLVGDTPLDVAAAQAGGARAIGVATGPYSVAELEDSGADAVLPDLRDAERLVAAVLAVG
ncbi:MAG TPA: HAD family hydrolase [Solirubrobacterales bacterium]|nr:HAD family hydrolase [Solirubrobacterales bacterium]